MSRQETYAIGVGSPGGPLRVADFDEKFVQLAGVGTAHLNVEGSIDGAHYFVTANGSDVHADGIVEIRETVVLLRLNVTSGDASNLVARLSGRNARAS